MRFKSRPQMIILSLHGEGVGGMRGGGTNGLWKHRQEKVEYKCKRRAAESVGDYVSAGHVLGALLTLIPARVAAIVVNSFLLWHRARSPESSPLTCSVVL